MFQLRENGKFFTDPISAKTIQEAFSICIEGLLERKFMTSVPQKFTRVLLSSEESVHSSMWEYALLEEKNDTHSIFSIYDTGGWRFFGRV